MKKLFLAFIAVVATCLGSAAQISLNDAYTGLVNHPGAIEKKAGNVELAPGIVIANLQTVTYKTPRYSQDFIYTVESLPLQNQLISAGNRNEMACAFTEPSKTGIYNVLFLIGEKGGKYMAAYGQTNAQGLEAIRNSEVNIDGDSLVMGVAPTVDVVEFFSMEVVE